MERDPILAEVIYCLNTIFRLIWNHIINQPKIYKKRIEYTAIKDSVNPLPYFRNRRKICPTSEEV